VTVKSRHNSEPVATGADEITVEEMFGDVIIQYRTRLFPYCIHILFAPALFIAALCIAYFSLYCF
jgi:hypothetical protein